MPLFTVDEIIEKVTEIRAGGGYFGDLSLAILIASNALGQETDKSNVDYMHHVTSVAFQDTNSETKMIIGILHDVIEDSEWTFDDLRRAGFSERIVNGVDGVTKRDGELYFDFVKRCAQNKDSVDVKIKDLKHNTSIHRNDFIQNKYIIALQYLIDIKRHQSFGVPPNFMVWMQKQDAKLQNFELLEKHYSGYGIPASALDNA